jgi:hypothetical protein
VKGAKLFKGTSFNFYDGIFWYDKDVEDKLKAAKKAGKQFGEAIFIDETYKRKAH